MEMQQEPETERDGWRVRRVGMTVEIVDRNEQVIAQTCGSFESRERRAALIVRAVNNHDALIEALEAIAPRCDQVVNRDTGARCGGIAVAVGSFGFKYCRAHRGHRELVDVGVQVETALSAAQEQS